MKRISTVLLLTTIFMTACGKNTDIPIPQGVRTVHGYLQPVPFSLKRRGTHGLFSASGGTLLLYAESNAVNLHALEDREIDLTGTFEKNSDATALPVLVVSKATETGGDQMRPWTIPALGLSIQVPKAWKGALQGKSATFTASGFAQPVLTVTVRSVASEVDPVPLYGPQPVPSSSELLVVGLRKATADITADGQAWLVRVAPSGGQQVEFHFALQPERTVDDQLWVYRKILHSVEFRTLPSSAHASSSIARSPASAPSSATAGSSMSRATGEGAPCGGIAGILCPRGLFCRILDAQTESGVCTKK